MVKELTLTRGQKTLVDDDVYEWAIQWKWNAQWDKKGQRFYAARPYQMPDGRRGTLWLGRAIMGTPEGKMVDHRSGNTLDDRRENLRICTNSQNQANQGTRHVAKTSTYKGVYQDKARNQWRASIKVNGKTRHLGRFSDELQAARAYDQAAIAYFGEFARINGA